MDNKKKLIIILLVFVLVIGAASVLYTRLGKDYAAEQLAVETPQSQNGASSGSETSDTEQAQSESVKAPDFTVYDAQGNKVQLSDFVGKPVVLNFWASWCGPCKMEMPDFDEKYKQLGEEVHFLMVNMTGGQETQQKATKFIEESGYSFPVFYDTDTDAARTYEVYSIPATYFIDADGGAVAMANGAIDAETLQRGIDMVYSPK